VTKYDELVQQAGATFVNDHIAFRTLAGSQPLTGIASLSRVFEALSYRPAGCYSFEDKHLNAIHYEHPNAEFPKVFISELKVWELNPTARKAMERTLATHRPAITNETLAELSSLVNADASQHTRLMEILIDWFHRLPWGLPEQRDVVEVNQESQYAAWVMVHGYNVNHFTSLVNSHNVPSLDDIEKTIAALVQAGVPMKAEIEGMRGSKLRQSATEAVHIEVDVLEDGRPARIPWTYAYFELAERGMITDAQTGERRRFEGFLGAQATQLFEMTKVS
jgi:hypothetical protein